MKGVIRGSDVCCGDVMTLYLPSGGSNVQREVVVVVVG